MVVVILCFLLLLYLILLVVLVTWGEEVKDWGESKCVLVQRMKLRGYVGY